MTNCVKVPLPHLCWHQSWRQRRGTDHGMYVGWCLDCGSLTWRCAVGDMPPRDAQEYEDWLNENLVAWSCSREAEGRGQCSRWCGRCTASLRDSGD